jgi:hypothetical protein
VASSQVFVSGVYGVSSFMNGLYSETTQVCNNAPVYANEHEGVITRHNGTQSEPYWFIGNASLLLCTSDYTTGYAAYAQYTDANGADAYRFPGWVPANTWTVRPPTDVLWAYEREFPSGTFVRTTPATIAATPPAAASRATGPAAAAVAGSAQRGQHAQPPPPSDDALDALLTGA